MRICAACGVFRAETLIVGRNAFVGSLDHNERTLIEKSNAFIVAVEVVGVINLIKSLMKFIHFYY